MAFLYVLENLLNDVTLSKLNSLSGDFKLWTVIFKSFLLLWFLQHMLCTHSFILLFNIFSAFGVTY